MTAGAPRPARDASVAVLVAASVAAQIRAGRQRLLAASAPVHAAGARRARPPGATDARYKVRVMEGVLEKSVQQAALRLNEQLQRVSPDLIQLAGAAHARGYRLEGYGLFFDVEVPAAMRQTMGWTARVMRQQHEGVSEALGALKRITGELDPRTAPRPSAPCGDSNWPSGRCRAGCELASARWAPCVCSGSDQASTPRRAGSGRPDGDKPTIVVAPHPQADALLWRSPDLAYEDQVREALIGAMLDWGALAAARPPTSGSRSPRATTRTS